jgi:hypothetical protein
MDDPPLRARAEAHIAAMARRTAADHDRLASHLRGWCRPGGATDRTEPVARGWSPGGDRRASTPSSSSAPARRAAAPSATDRGSSRICVRDH